jgi:colanic acid biosynthesis glycosyl transferase WcaI
LRVLVNDFCGHPFQLDLSRELARRGHHVLHIYFAGNHSTPKGDTVSVSGSKGSIAIEGLHIQSEFAKHSLLTRRSADIAYGKAAAASLARFAPDLVISANMPLDAQNILQQAARRHHAKFIFWLQDVYSYAVEFVLRKKLGRLAAMPAAHYRRLEKKLLKQSDAVVCIAPGFAEVALQWGVSPSRIHTIENWAPPSEIIPMSKHNAWAEEHGVHREFCFMYSGTLGMKHRPELLQALGEYLEQRGSGRLLVIAEGAGADWLRAQTKTWPKTKLQLLPFQAYHRLSEVFAASDVLIGLLDAEAGVFAVPSKILSYLCAGRAVMLAAPEGNHAATVVRRASAGIVISPDNAGEFVSAATQLMADADWRASCARHARSYAEQSFNISRIADRFLDVFEQTWEPAATGRPGEAEQVLGKPQEEITVP